MPVGIDVLNTTLSDLRGPLIRTFERRDPSLRAVLDKGQKIKNEGSYIERNFTGGAPAHGVGIFSGDELLNMTRRQHTKRFIVEPARLVVAINIPKRDLGLNSGSGAVTRLIKEYPQSVMSGVMTDFNSYFLQGVSRGKVFQTNELRGRMTLNSQVTSGRGTGVTTGLISFAAPSAQTDTIQSVAKSASYDLYNQYGDITGWSTNGMRALRSTWRKCADYADNGKGPDVCIMDPDTFANFDESKYNLIQTRQVEDKTDKSDGMSYDFMLGKVYYEGVLSPANFSGAAADGITYMLNTDFIEQCFITELKMSDFSERVGDQDVVTATLEVHDNIIFTKFPVHGAVTGGNA